MTTQLLTTDTVRAERLAEYCGRDWRAAPGLRAGWSVAFGPVTQVLFLQALGEDGVPPPPLAGPDEGLELRARQWLREVNPHRPASGGVTHFELRIYDARLGEGARFLDFMLRALPIRERHSPNFGIWESLSGRHEQVFHLWGYRGLAERDTVRAGLKADPDWQAYITTILPLLQVLHSTILVPLARC